MGIANELQVWVCDCEEWARMPGIILRAVKYQNPSCAQMRQNVSDLCGQRHDRLEPEVCTRRRAMLKKGVSGSLSQACKAHQAVTSFHLVMTTRIPVYSAGK